MFRDTITALLKDGGAAWSVEMRNDPEHGFVIVMPHEDEAE